MRNIQEKIEHKTRKFARDLEEISTFAKGSNLIACSKAYKLQFRLIKGRAKYDRSMLIRQQLRRDLLWDRIIKQPSSGLPRSF